MPVAEARIRTGRASRYLTQLCGHTARMNFLGHANRHGEHATATAMPQRAECSDTDGVIDFDRGRLTLRATNEELILVAEADDQQDLRLMQDAIATRLQRIGRRDRLSLTWRPAPAQPGHGDGGAAAILERLMTPAGRAQPFPLYAAAHKQGIMSLKEVEYCVLEPTGTLSFIQRRPTAGFQVAKLRHDARNVFYGGE